MIKLEPKTIYEATYERLCSLKYAKECNMLMHREFKNYDENLLGVAIYSKEFRQYEFKPLSVDYNTILKFDGLDLNF
jgi:hypothetical protein